MSIGRVILLWLITIVLGSIISPILMAGYSNELFTDIIWVIPLFMITSLVTSIPALLIVALSITWLEDVQMDVKRKVKILYAIHGITGVVTFIVIGLGTNTMYTLVPFVGPVYLFVGLLSWRIGFKMEATPKSI